MTAIRPERPGDAAAIRAVTAAAFAGAPHASGAEAAILDALRGAGALSLSLVAGEAGEAGEVAGHAAFSPVTIAGREAGWLGLGPVSVRPDLQRRGIGSALIRAGLDQSAAAGCVVLGDPGYYARFGFAPDPGLTLDGAPPAYFMARPRAGPVPRGAVAYPPAFGA